MQKKKTKLFKRNGLTIILVTMGVVVLIGQIFTGLHEHNDELVKGGMVPLDLFQYLGSGHFLQTTFENLESEFLQMAIFVVLTACLFQKGSSESKPLPEEQKETSEPPVTKDSPWPVRKGGFILKLYENSLSIALGFLFLVSFYLHAYGSWIDYNLEQSMEGNSKIGLIAYLGHNRFWYESFQNWQSEFLSIAAIVFLSIYLRQKNSPQSKPVNMPHSETKD